MKKRFNIINGSSIKVNLSEEYLSIPTVANFAYNHNMKDLTNVYGFRRESTINNTEGYIKYYLDRKKCRFIYFSYADIYHVMGFVAAEKFITKVENVCENEE